MTNKYHYRGYSILTQQTTPVAHSAAVFNEIGNLIVEVFTLNGELEAKRGAMKRIDAYEFYSEGGIAQSIRKFMLRFSRKGNAQINEYLQKVTTFKKNRAAAKRAKVARRKNRK